jgi:hypothetical protein
LKCCHRFGAQSVLEVRSGYEIHVGEYQRESTLLRASDYEIGSRRKRSVNVQLQAIAARLQAVHVLYAHGL